MTKYELTANVNGVRLDQFVADSIEDLTRTSATTLIENGNILVNSQPKKKNYKLVCGDAIVVSMPDPVEPKIISFFITKYL